MRRIQLIAAGAAALALAGHARADTEDVGTQELGVSLGLEGGGRVSPGGLRLGGAYLYRLAESDWLESGIGFTFGSSGAACFRDRDDDLICDHGLLDGFAAEVSIGVRRFFAGQKGFVPFAGAGLAVRLASYAGDDVVGLALPLYGLGGVRSRVAERVAVFGAATVKLGAGLYDEDLGIEPHFTLTVLGGVDFALP